MTAPLHLRISQGVPDGPAPPLAGALAAWVLRDDGEITVVDPVGAPPQAGGGALWAHLEWDAGPDRIEQIAALPGSARATLFGPGVDDPERRELLRARLGDSIHFAPGDPERELPGRPALDPAHLPLTTYAGFGTWGGGHRLLAGRGDRLRPVAAVIREVVYLVEMRQLGHVLFDDAALGEHPAWLDAFRAELAHLPWPVSWQAPGVAHRLP